MNASFADISQVINDHESFVVLSHVRPDGDAIGSQLALGSALEGMGKTVHYVNEDGLPSNLAFLPDSDKILTPPKDVLDVEVCIALDCATKPRLGDNALHAASAAKTWINIDHHKTNPGYGDLNYIDSSAPATGQILYELITSQGMPFSATTRDTIYVAVSTDTGSFRYSSTTKRTYEMAADLVERGVNVGEINTLTYDSAPYRKVELLRRLLNTLELNDNKTVADWQLHVSTKEELALKPDDSEDMIDHIRAIDTVQVAAFFEELGENQIRVSLRSKVDHVDCSELASQFGGGGHSKAAGIRMDGPIQDARKKVLDVVYSAVKKG